MERRRITNLQSWKEEEGSLTFSLGRKKKEHLPSVLEGRRRITNLQSWKEEEGSLTFSLGKKKDH